MTVRLIGILILCSILSPFPSSGQYQVNKTASKESCACFQLTPDNNYMRGSVWRTEKIDLTEPFDLRFELFFGNNNGGADGIVIMFQPNSDTIVGGNGGGIGYEGIDTSLAVEFDTWLNAWGDPQEDHIAILQNGSVDHNSQNNLAGPVDALPGGGNIEDTSYHDARLTWDPDSQELRAYLDGHDQLSYSGNIIDNIFYGDSLVYWGLSSGTAAAKNEHRFCTKLIPEFDVKDSVVCENDTVFFYDSSYATAGDIVDYEWKFGDGGSSNDTNPEHVFKGPGIYDDIELIVTAPDSCVDTVEGSASIEILEAPDADLRKEGACFGDSVRFFDESEGTVDHRLWELGDGSSSTEQNPSHLYASPGEYTVSLYLENSNGCSDRAEQTFHQADAFEASIEGDPVICYSEGGELQATPTGADHLWSDGSSGQKLEVSDTGTYWVKVDKGGCVKADTLDVRGEYCETLAEFPNVFTPNGDGKNELASPVELQNIEELHTRIYNRWGQLLYESRSKESGWDGTTVAGKKAPEGTYFWIISYTSKDGEKGERTGSLELIR